MEITLVGGGPEDGPTDALVRRFVRACDSTEGPVAVVLAGDEASAAYFGQAYRRLLAPLGHRLQLVPTDQGLDALAGCAALVVGGGPTPVYHAALQPHAATVRDPVLGGMPYLGFSAGAMVAAERALVGGWRHEGRPVAPEDWSEGLDELDVQPGLGLVPWTVEVHAAQAGTLGRGVSAVLGEADLTVVALDEGTALHVGDLAAPEVLGTGHAWWITREQDAATVRVQPATAGR